MLEGGGFQPDFLIAQKNYSTFVHLVLRKRDIKTLRLERW